MQIGRMNRSVNSIGRMNVRRRDVVSPWWLSGGIDPADCAAAYQAKGAASYAASLVDLTGNGNNLPTANYLQELWDASKGFGAASDGTAYFDTGINPGSSGDYTIIAAFSDLDPLAGATQSVMGMQNPTYARFYLRPIHSGDQRVYGYGSVAALISGHVLSGVMALNKSGGWYNGVQEATITGTWNTPARNIHLLTQPDINNLTARAMRSGYLIAAAIYPADISAYIPALTTAMNALLLF